METTAVAPKLKKGPSSRLIVLLFVLLIGGGIGIYFWVRPKKDADDEKEKNNNDGGSTGIKGRNNASSQNPGLTADQVAFLMGSGSGGFNNGSQNPNHNDDKGTTTPPPPPPKPIYIYGTQGQALIQEKMQRLQAREDVMDLIRAKYNTGLSMMGNSPDEQQAIDQLFGQLANMDWSADPAHRYLKFPVYGTKEQRGAKYRHDLQRFVDAGWEGFNLSHRRDSNARWWLPNIGLNLMVGTTSAFTPSADDVWFSHAGVRTHIDFFKRFNSFWVSDQQLTECVDKYNRNLTVHHHHHANATGAYCGGKQYSFAERWLAEIDRLDRVTEWEAIRALTAPKEDNGDGIWMTYINPDTGDKEPEPTDPTDSNTNPNSDIINV
ncbi:hypothetical protein [Aureispira anguillae]|uniref:Uncharacterized protein n=1 Tax=Aureispira anguillae TaxID=2864201 RepID=A0A916DPZ7_9BACT|nr:hypothetical protein [Aureispira anguillae]BDS10869.1 hypothetical protein AsAng_0015790 [Aureispira anguillae]